MKHQSVLFVGSVAIMVTLAGCGSPVSLPMPIVGDGAVSTRAPDLAVGADAGTSAGLVGALVRSGTKVEEMGVVTQPSLAVQGQILRVNGVDLQVYEYADTDAAAADAALISADGALLGGSMSAQHFFRQDRLIVLYVGDDMRTLQQLEETLGPQFAGSPIGAPEPTALPAGPGTVIGGRVWHDLCGMTGGGDGQALEPTSGCITVAESVYRADGKLKEGEPGIEGATVQLGAGACPAEGTMTAVTAADGSYLFTDLAPETYCVTVDAQFPANALLIPGSWTAPETPAEQSAASITVDLATGGNRRDVHFGWDYQFLPAAPGTIPPVPGVAPTNAPACADKAVMSLDVTAPDNTVVEPSSTFVKTWRLRNTGTCTWNNAYALVFVKGEQMGGPAATPFQQTVAPGTSTDLSVTLKAPAEPGTYRGHWSLRNAQGTVFSITNSEERTFWVQVVVQP